MTITDNQLKGNWGEQYIAANLAAQGCFIRHVTQGHDSGIDLYCETVKDNTPFLHFWCQIKTSKDYDEKSEPLSFTPDSEKKHKEYWLKQPVPVFIFLVPDLRDGTNIPYYICRAIDLQHNKTINSFAKIESPEDLSNKFLNGCLAIETLKWELKDGKVTSLKTTNSEKTEHFLSGATHDFENELVRSLDLTLWRLSQDNIIPIDLNKNNFNLNAYEIKKAKPYMKAWEILLQDKSEKGYHYYATLGLYYEFDELEKNYNKSLEHYEKSLSIINKDEDSWKITIEGIKRHIERVKSKMQMPSDSLVD
ncbi:MAG: DUF4365 domain-containing protein [Candidatus Methanoperedens sp.]